MKLIKFFVALIVILSLCFLSLAEKRKPRKSMKELTDRNSPSYVPYPYPKNKKEIFEDMKYFFVDLTAGAFASFVGEPPITDIITSDLFGPGPSYKIGKIVKVRNRISKMPDDFSWLVYIIDTEGDAVMRITVAASGLVLDAGAVDKKKLPKYPEKTRKKMERLMKVLDEKDVRKNLSDTLDYQIKDKDIKKLERVGFKSKIGDILYPMWEFTLKDGSVYYYSESRDMTFEIERRISWKKKNKFRTPIRDIVSLHDFIPDTISDELLTLKPASKRKKQ